MYYACSVDLTMLVTLNSISVDQGGGVGNREKGGATSQLSVHPTRGNHPISRHQYYFTHTQQCIFSLCAKIQEQSRVVSQFEHTFNKPIHPPHTDPLHSTNSSMWNGPQQRMSCKLKWNHKWYHCLFTFNLGTL